MPLAEKPDYPTDGENVTEEFLEAVVDILEIFGFTVLSGGTGQGSIQDINCASDMALSASKVADGAVVKLNTINPGTQEIERPTMFTAGALKGDPSSDDVETIVVTGGAPGTALNCTNRKRFKILDGDATADFNITTIVVAGAVDGDIITLIAMNDGSAANAINTVNTNTDTLNSLKLLGSLGIGVTAAEDRGTLGTFIYGKFGNTNSQWWQIG